MSDPVRDYPEARWAPHPFTHLVTCPSHADLKKIFVSAPALLIMGLEAVQSAQGPDRIHTCPSTAAVLPNQ